MYVISKFRASKADVNYILLYFKISLATWLIDLSECWRLSSSAEKWKKSEKVSCLHYNSVDVVGSRLGIQYKLYLLKWDVSQTAAISGSPM